MRRFLAYLVMMLTVSSCLAFNSQAIMERRTNDSEFGRGTKLTYALTQRESGDYNAAAYRKTSSQAFLKLSDTDIEKKVMSRLDSAGVRNADVEVVHGNAENEGYLVNVTFAPISDKELNNVKTVLSRTGSLSISTVGNKTIDYAESLSLFQDTVATVTYNDTTPYPTLNIEDNETMKTLISKAEEDSKTFTDSGEEKTEASTDSEDSSKTDYSKKLYLWQNFAVNGVEGKDKGQLFDMALGTNKTVVDEVQSSKLLAVLDTSNYTSESKHFTITSDKDGNAFDISTARALVTALNAEDYGFDIQYLYESATSATLGFGSERIALTAFGIALGLVSVLLIAFYGLGGLTASLDLIAMLLLSFLLFSAVGFEFSLSALLGFVVLAGLSVFVSVNYFARVKDLLRKGVPLEKANRDGYHASFLNGVDVSVIVFLAALFSFLVVRGPFRTFFGAVMVGTILVWVGTNYLNKWMVYWLCKDQTKAPRGLFSFAALKPTKEKSFVRPQSKPNVLSSSLVLGLTALLVGLSVPVSYALSDHTYGFVNASGDYGDSYTLRLDLREDTNPISSLATADDYVLYLERIGEQNSLHASYTMAEIGDGSKDATFRFDPESASLNVVTKKNEKDETYYVQYFTVKVDRLLDDSVTGKGQTTPVLSVIQNAIRNDSIDIGTAANPRPVSFAGDSHFVADDLFVGSFKADSGRLVHDANEFLIVLFVLTFFASIYTFLRFGLCLFLTQAIAGTAFAGLTLGLTAATRLPFSSVTAMALLASLLLFQIVLIPTFSLYKTYLKERGIKKEGTSEARAKALSDALQATMEIPVAVLLSEIVFGVSLLFLGKDVLPAGLALIVLSVLSFVLFLFLAVPLEFLFTDHISFRKLAKRAEARRMKREQKQKASVASGVRYVDDGPHETIVPGLNDFRSRQ